MGGDYNLWHGGIHTPAMRVEVEAVLRRSFGVDTRTPTMYAQYLRRKYPKLYEEVRQSAQEH